MTTYTQYEQRIRTCFADAYNFWFKHKYVRTPEDWSRIAKELTKYPDDFTQKLLLPVFDELDHEFKNYEKQKGIPRN